MDKKLIELLQKYPEGMIAVLTPKEKAQELIEKFIDKVPNIKGICANYIDVAKQCARILIVEMYKEGLYYHNEQQPKSDERHKYWKEVKSELDKL